MIKKILWFLLLLVMASSCLNEPDCYRLNNNIIGITFKNEDGTASTVTFTSITSITPDGTTIQFIPPAGNKFYLPLNYFQNTTTFYFEQAARKDTINLKYAAQAQYVSSDCGVRYVLSDLGIAEHTFNEARLVLTTPKNNASGNHIELFF